MRVRSIPKAIYNKVLGTMPAPMEEFISMWIALGYAPNMRVPRTFNEHIAHRKLFGHDSRFVRLADKWAVRSHVEARIGVEYLVEVHQLAHQPSEIVLATLPTSFVVKGRHDWGTTMLVDNKLSLDPQAFSRHLERIMARTHGRRTNEYWYEEIPLGIIVEERLHDANYGVPADFKFFVFHGKARLVEMSFSRLQGHARRYYEPSSWSPLEVTRPGDVIAPIIERPRQLDDMLRVAEELGKDFDFVRVDLYAPDDERVLFGEMTFAPEAGRRPFIPRHFDSELGGYW